MASARDRLGPPPRPNDRRDGSRRRLDREFRRRVDLARRRPHPPARAPRAAGEPVRRGVVHALALYLAAGGTHALDHADEVDDLLVLDGPIYPKELFTWDDRNPELGARRPRGEAPRRSREVRPAGRAVRRARRAAGRVREEPPAGRSFARWLGRASNRRGPTTRRFFSPALGAARGRRGRRRQPTRPRRRRAHLHHVVPQSGRRRRDDGRRRRRARHRTRARPGAVRADVHGRVRPRTDVTYHKLEAPYAFARDPSIRERLTRQVLADVATTRVRRRRSRRPTSWRGSRRRKRSRSAGSSRNASTATSRRPTTIGGGERAVLNRDGRAQRGITARAREVPREDDRVVQPV